MDGNSRKACCDRGDAFAQNSSLTRFAASAGDEKLMIPASGTADWGWMMKLLVSEARQCKGSYRTDAPWFLLRTAQFTQIVDPVEKCRNRRLCFGRCIWIPTELPTLNRRHYVFRVLRKGWFIGFLRFHFSQKNGFCFREPQLKSPVKN